jgi:hypothetical protein
MAREARHEGLQYFDGICYGAVCNALNLLGWIAVVMLINIRVSFELQPFAQGIL